MLPVGVIRHQHTLTRFDGATGGSKSKLGLCDPTLTKACDHLEFWIIVMQEHATKITTDQDGGAFKNAFKHRFGLECRRQLKTKCVDRTRNFGPTLRLEFGLA
jgi:hypothetical protein